MKIADARQKLTPLGCYLWNKGVFLRGGSVLGRTLLGATSMLFAKK